MAANQRRLRDPKTHFDVQVICFRYNSGVKEILKPEIIYI